MEPGSITLAEFVDASNRAASNAAEKPQFRRLLKELEGLPKTRERLVFEMLDAAWQCLEQKVDPLMLVVRIGAWNEAVEDARLLDFLDKTEALLVGYLDRMPLLKGSDPILTLPALLNVIRQKSPSRFQALIERLKREEGSAASDSRRKIIARIEPFLL